MKKIENYLNSKEKSEYSNLDRIFELCLSKDMKKLLSKYTGVEIYPTIHQSFKAIQLKYRYHNICVTMDFLEDKYSAVVYYVGITATDLEKLFIDYDYQDNFNFEKLIKKMDEKIKNHPKLKDTTSIEEKRKIYSLIAWISLCLSIVILGGIGLYCMMNESAVQGTVRWGIFFIVIPLIVWFICDVKLKRLK